MVANEKIVLRLTVAQKAWLVMRKAQENLSQNAQVQRLIDSAMEADPLLLTVHEAHFPDGGIEFDVTIGEDNFKNDFPKVATKVEAIQVAKAKLEQLGLPLSHLRFRRHNFQTD